MGIDEGDLIMRLFDYSPAPSADLDEYLTRRHQAIANNRAKDSIYTGDKYKRQSFSLPKNIQEKFIIALDPLLTRKGALIWLYEENDEFDGQSPAQVIMDNQPERVMQIIRDQIDDDIPYY